jgi:hypothetical protein
MRDDRRTRAKAVVNRTNRAASEDRFVWRWLSIFSTLEASRWREAEDVRRRTTRRASRTVAATSMPAVTRNLPVRFHRLTVPLWASTAEASIARAQLRAEGGSKMSLFCRTSTGSYREGSGRMASTRPNAESLAMAELDRGSSVLPAAFSKPHRRNISGRIDVSLFIPASRHTVYTVVSSNVTR